METNDQTTQLPPSPGATCSAEINSEYCDFPTCPNCGHEYRDGWECFTDHVEDTEITCPECENEYACCVHTTIQYSSKLLPNVQVDAPAVAATPQHQKGN